MKGVPFLAKMVCKRVGVWTLGMGPTFPCGHLSHIEIKRTMSKVTFPSMET